MPCSTPKPELALAAHAPDALDGARHHFEQTLSQGGREMAWLCESVARNIGNHVRRNVARI